MAYSRADTHQAGTDDCRIRADATAGDRTRQRHIAAVQVAQRVQPALGIRAARIIVRHVRHQPQLAELLLRIKGDALARTGARIKVEIPACIPQPVDRLPDSC